jgi:hypothetical protein
MAVGALVGWLFVRAEAADPVPQTEHVLVAATPVTRTATPAPQGVQPAATNSGAGIQESNVAPTSGATGSEDDGASDMTAAAAVDGLKLLRQSVRRGGLGSKALMTLTIRNINDYPVKDIAVSCTFRSRDGHYVTERRQVIDGIVKTKSRRIFRRKLVGFVSVLARHAKCSLLTADRA